MKNKRTYLFYFLLAVYSKSFAFKSGDEENKNKIFKEWGYTVLLDFYQNPVQRYIYDPGNGNGPDTGYFRGFGFTLASIQYTIRYNLHNISDDQAFSLSATPCFAFGPWTADAEGLGMLNVPILVNYEIGAGATYVSAKEKGGFIGAGIELCKTPAVYIYNGTLHGGIRKKSLWMEPVLSAGYRYWSNTNRLRTVGLKFGMGGSRPYREDQSSPMIESRSWTFRLYVSTFIGY